MLIPDPIDGACGGGCAAGSHRPPAARARESLRPKSKTGLEVGAKAPKFTLKDQDGQGALAGRIPQQGQGRPGVLSLGRLVTVLPQATGPVATRPQV